MHRTLTALLASAALAAPAAAAEVSVQVQVAAPAIRFLAPPPLVVVAPGIQVVADYNEEIFFFDGWYWVRMGPSWYRTKTYRGGWTVVAAPAVPAVLVKLPPGKFKKYKAAPPPQAPAYGARGEHPGHGRGHGKK
jgi:hypothetical protein